MNTVAIFNLAIFTMGFIAAVYVFFYLFWLPSDWLFPLLMLIGGACMSALSIVGMYIYYGGEFSYHYFFTDVLPLRFWPGVGIGIGVMISAFAAMFSNVIRLSANRRKGQ